MIDQLTWVRELRSAGLRLRRSWPRSADHLLLELRDRNGHQVAGQWFADADRAASVASGTPGSRRHGSVLLQPDGADRRLPDLVSVLRTPGASLVSHRPERRAVIAGPGGHRKVVRAANHHATVQRARLARTLEVGAPRVLSADPGTGSLLAETLAGEPLTAVLSSSRSAQACAAVGRRLAELHAVRPEQVVDAGLAVHGPDEERAVLRRWNDLGAAYGIGGPAQDRLGLPPPASIRVIHRDFHDGQVIMNGSEPGILDFDLLALGDPALDLANFLAHLELRAEQGLVADAAPAIAGTIDGYRPDASVRAALPAYRAAARERLRVVYAFRDPELVS